MSEKFTREQALAIMGFTGVVTLRFDIFHEDVEKRLGHPVWTHEFASKEMEDKIKTLYRDEFLAMCPDDKKDDKPHA